MNPKKRNELISGFLSESLSQEECDTLFEEVSLNPTSKREYLAKVKNWLSADTSQVGPTEKIRLFGKIKKNIRSSQRKAAMHCLLRTSQVAAVLIFMFGLGYYANELMQPTDSPFSLAVVATDSLTNHSLDQTTNTEILVPRGSRSRISMPDGSKIWINADSKVSYSSQYAKDNRDIYLEGEAYFEVAQDTGLLFRVFSGDICITATGTAFNVEAYSANIKTTLLEGSINVSSSNGKSRRVKPNQSVVFDNAHSDFNVTSNVTAELYTSWKDERWIIRSMSLEELAQKLEKRYNVCILFSDESIKQNKISATLTTETIEQVMQALNASMYMNYSIQRNIITISRHIP